MPAETGAAGASANSLNAWTRLRSTCIEPNLLEQAFSNPAVSGFCMLDYSVADIAVVESKQNGRLGM